MFLTQIFAQASPVQAFDLNFSVSFAAAALVYLAGIACFFYWLIRTSFGTEALCDSVHRPNNMPFYLPFLIIFIWLAATSAASQYFGIFSSDLGDWRQELFTFVPIAVVELLIIVLIIASAKRFFVQGLKGLGINLKTIATDVTRAVLNLVSVWPLVTGMLLVVMYMGSYFGGEDFQMQQNVGLEVLLKYDNIWLRIFMIVFAAGITPVFEELLFRGLFQTMLRSFNVGAWRSIFLTSIVFAALHPAMHFPALLVLSVCMGYSYEKSGSLLRPIIIHLLFNSVSITFALLQG